MKTGIVSLKLVIILVVSMFAVINSRADEIEDFVSNKHVTVYVTKDGKEFHSKGCPDRPSNAIPLDFGDVMAQHPEMFPSACLDTPRFREVYKVYVEVILEGAEKTLSARKELLRRLEDINPPGATGQQAKIKPAYRSYVIACQKLKLRFSDTALVELLKNGLGNQASEKDDATVKQKAEMKAIFDAAVQRGVRDAKLPKVDVERHLMIFGLSDALERDGKRIEGLKNRSRFVH